MGIPQNYSFELPERCFQLLEGLWRFAAEIYPKYGKEQGPLTSTFLLSMSFPILMIPVERLERAANQEASYVDDNYIDAPASEAIVKLLQTRKLKDVPFFEVGVWSFAFLDDVSPPNISRGLPEAISRSLSHPDAKSAAAELPALKWISVLRNALSHGGVVYLDDRGNSDVGRAAKEFAFFSGQYDRKVSPPKLIGVNFLRISEQNYFTCLRLWVRWLLEAKS